MGCLGVTVMPQRLFWFKEGNEQAPHAYVYIYIYVLYIHYNIL